MVDSLHPSEIRVIPGWIYNSILRNNLNIVDICNYNKLRSCVSIEDLAAWNYLFDISLTYSQDKLVSTNLISWFTNITKDELNEFNNTVIPLSLTDNLRQSVGNRLSINNPLMEYTYKFVLVNNNLIIVLNEGFLDHINNRVENKKLFYNQYLKWCYSILPIHEVSKLPIYYQYLELLNK